MIEDATERRWTVYGRVKLGLDEVGQVRMRGFHLDRVPTLEQANAYIEDAIAKYGPGGVDCVLVELKRGLDRDGERRVIRRTNDFKSWWE